MAEELSDDDVAGVDDPGASPSEELAARNAEAAAEPSPSDELAARNAEAAAAPSPSEELAARNAEAAAEPSPSEELDARNAEAAAEPGAWDSLVESNKEAAAEPSPSDELAARNKEAAGETGKESDPSNIPPFHHSTIPPSPAAPTDKPSQADPSAPHEYKLTPTPTLKSASLSDHEYKLHPTPRLSDYDKPFHPTPKLSDYTPKLTSPDNLNREQPRDEDAPVFAGPGRHGRAFNTRHHASRMSAALRRMSGSANRRGRLSVAS